MGNVAGDCSRSRRTLLEPDSHVIVATTLSAALGEQHSGDGGHNEGQVLYCLEIGPVLLLTTPS